MAWNVRLIYNITSGHLNAITFMLLIFQGNDMLTKAYDEMSSKPSLEAIAEEKEGNYDIFSIYLCQ